MSVRGRIFNIIQYLEIDGEKLVDMDLILDSLEKYSFGRWAYAIHNQDVYVEEDREVREAIVAEKTEKLEILKNKEEKTQNDEEEIKKIEKALKYYERFPVVVGQPKPPHIHIVVEYPSTCSSTQISKWLGIPEFLVDVPKGKNAFLDCVQYLTHERAPEIAKGKHLYSDDVVKANFDFRKTLDERETNRKKYGRDLDEKQLQRQKVLQEGKTLKQCLHDNPILFADEHRKLKPLREFWLDNQDPPKWRINIYISGESGTGKTVLSNVLGRALAKRINSTLTDKNDMVHAVGATGVEFDGYDGQPVILWNDCRADRLLEGLGCTSNFLNVFCPNPEKIRQKVKYGYANLINYVNIVEGIQEPNKFFPYLAGNEDKQQVYRRFPILIELGHSTFTIFCSKKFFGAKKVKKYNDYDIWAMPFSVENIMASDLSENEKNAKIEEAFSIIVNLILKKIRKQNVKDETVSQLSQTFPAMTVDNVIPITATSTSTSSSTSSDTSSGSSGCGCNDEVTSSATEGEQIELPR